MHSSLQGVEEWVQEGYTARKYSYEASRHKYTCCNSKDWQCESSFTLEFAGQMKVSSDRNERRQFCLAYKVSEEYSIG
jgi:hypothetical protein